MKQSTIEFLKREFQTQCDEYIKLTDVKALALKERGEVFVGKYIGTADGGFVVFKVRASEQLPRKSSFWTAYYLLGEMASYKNWGDCSWADLRSRHRGDYSDVFCAWLSKMKDEPDFYMVGFKGFSAEFVEDVLVKNKPIIAFGPQQPPLEYLDSLREFVENKLSAIEERVLNCSSNEGANFWSPVRVNKGDDLTRYLLEQFKQSDVISVQGPPGTGKTYRMAQFISTLLGENKSVLAVSLTNEALKVLATKDALSSALVSGKINKTSLSTDEQMELPRLASNKGNKYNPQQGHLSLATFYVASRWAAQMSEGPLFDYVVVDEASQAYLPMLVASLRLGGKVVWIGDQNQLAPIAQTNDDLIQSKGWRPIVKGFDTVCKHFEMPGFMLGDTFRLTERGAEFTSVFYHSPLCSVATHQPQSVPIGATLPLNGGPVLIDLPLRLGDKAPQNAIGRIETVLGEILSINPKAEVAILAKFKETVRTLQKYFAPQEGTASTLKIETVDRIQGMTVDYTIFLIPNSSVNRSLEKEFFNVATSRAKYATIIIADVGVMRENMPEEVRRFFLKLHEGKVASFTPKEVASSGGDIRIKVLGKIELSDAKTPPKNILDKDAVYILDTNVFVDCPNVISRLGGAKVVVPTTVIEELDKLKLKGNIDQCKLREAIKNINTAFAKDYSNMEAGDLTLLPAGFDRGNPDCLILSVALKHKNNGANPVVLTSDINLQSRARGMHLRTCSLKELLRNS